MTTHVALLRAVNVGGRGKVAMADLRDCLTAMGFHKVRTVLQSGNVVFEADVDSRMKGHPICSSKTSEMDHIKTDGLDRRRTEAAA